MSNKFDALKDETDEDYGINGKEANEDIIVPPGEHKLQCPYWLWYCRRSGKAANPNSYDQNLKLIAKMATVEQFWSVYSHITRPCDMPTGMDFHLFKVGIKPMWEDEANQHGGKWIVRLRKGQTSRSWENLILAMLGEQFQVGKEVCGAVVSVRYGEDILSIWNRTASDKHTTEKIRDTMRRILSLPASVPIEYKTHNDSLRDNSSFRNTIAEK